MKASCLSKKQVVSMQGGEMIGKIVDFEFDPNHFQIEAVCIEKHRSFLFGWMVSFFHDARVVMDVSRIVSIGSDVILVDCVHPNKKREDHK